ncbi:MAG: phenylacetate--CoA ligase [Armatimonadota bacterium]|nr:MAG: phenylacetate--CoA ligase [Armatimonadota bacterium]
MAMWKPEIETMPRADVLQLQLERLQAATNRAYKNVAFYRKKFDELGIVPEQIQSLDDLRRLPLTTKDDLRQAYPYGMFGVPLREVVRVHASSGTTGHPTVCGYTRRDLQTWSELVARVMTAGGVTHDDVVQICFGYGLFTGAFGLHYGAELIGASVIPASSGNTERQIVLMQDFRTTALVGTPSYALRITEVMDEMRVTPSELSLRVGLFGAEPWSERIRSELEKRLHISATDNYGLSEVMGPGVAGECDRKDGLHVSEDHFIAEVIDPGTGEPLSLGEEGELVLTTLTKEALPLIRYRTRDVTRLNAEPCACGRTLMRMARVQTRTDDMLIVRGVNVYPSQIEAVLAEIEGLEPHYQIVLDRVGAMDQMEVWVEVPAELFGDAVASLRQMEERIAERMRSVLGLSPKIRLVEPRSLQRFEGKSQRVIDKRN